MSAIRKIDELGTIETYDRTVEVAAFKLMRNKQRTEADLAAYSSVVLESARKMANYLVKRTEKVS